MSQGGCWHSCPAFAPEKDAISFTLSPEESTVTVQQPLPQTSSKSLEQSCQRLFPRPAQESCLQLQDGGFSVGLDSS